MYGLHNIRIAVFINAVKWIYKKYDNLSPAQQQRVNDGIQSLAGRFLKK